MVEMDALEWFLSKHPEAVKVTDHGGRDEYLAVVMRREGVGSTAGYYVGLFSEKGYLRSGGGELRDSREDCLTRLGLEGIARVEGSIEQVEKKLDLLFGQLEAARASLKQSKADLEAVEEEGRVTPWYLNEVSRLTKRVFELEEEEERLPRLKAELEKQLAQLKERYPAQAVPEAL